MANQFYHIKLKTWNIKSCK